MNGSTKVVVARLVAAGIVFGAGTAGSQEATTTAVRAEDIVITASRVETPRRETPDLVQVIDRAAVEEINATTTGELLDYVTGTAPDNPNGLTTPLKDYTKLDAGINVAVRNSYEAYLKVENILGEDIEHLDDAYTVIDGAPTMLVGLRYCL
jgi:outer membrane cobalamin receptor